jgi:hypothetical protein
MIIEGKAVVIDKDNVDTDVLYPGTYLSIDDPEEMKPYLFEALDPSLRDQLDGPTILVVGGNFGAGSSREHVPHAMKASKIVCVVGKSFARIFHRNCLNLGLPTNNPRGRGSRGQTGGGDPDRQGLGRNRGGRRAVRDGAHPTLYGRNGLLGRSDSLGPGEARRKGRD